MYGSEAIGSHISLYRSNQLIRTVASWGIVTSLWNTHANQVRGLGFRSFQVTAQRLSHPDACGFWPPCVPTPFTIDLVWFGFFCSHVKFTKLPLPLSCRLFLASSHVAARHLPFHASIKWVRIWLDGEPSGSLKVRTRGPYLRSFPKRGRCPSLVKCASFYLLGYDGHSVCQVTDLGILWRSKHTVDSSFCFYW